MFCRALFVSLLLACVTALVDQPAQAEIAAAHVYHNHMPNFWPYYDVTQYNATPVGGPIRYTYDAKTGTNMSTDAGGIAGYDVYRNGVKIGSHTTNAYTDNGLTTGTTSSTRTRAPSGGRTST